MTADLDALARDIAKRAIEDVSRMDVWDHLAEETDLENWDGGVPDAILAKVRALASYLSPRTVSTADELDALPAGAVVRGGGNAQIALKVETSTVEWRVPGDDAWEDAAGLRRHFDLPLSVLYVPSDGAR